jgi:hypothetical protein
MIEAAPCIIVPVLVVVAIPSLLYLSVSKRKNPVTLGFILAGIHLSLVLYAAHSHRESEFPGLDFLLYLIDMPISLLLESVAGSLGFGSRPGAFFKFGYFGVLGSAQYFLWGFLLGRLFARKRQEPRT